MKFRPLGRTGLQVSTIGLGTMTFGEQNTEAEAHAQLDAALEAGVNLVDTAEMYPVPPRPETQGRTEQFIGSWLAARGAKARDAIVLASKAAGPSHTPQRPSHVRGGATRFTRANLEQAVDLSLRRLQTDRLELYQLHWPDRQTNTFGQRGYVHAADDRATPIEETLEALDGLVKAGKIRHYGLSNETPWGVSRFLAASQAGGQARPASIQNAYSLLNRTFEEGLAEFAHREDIGLLAYSPLAFGLLSGKYIAGAKPEAARLSLFDRWTRYSGEGAELAVIEYVRLFRQHGVDPAQGALAFVASRPFVTSTIIGATTPEQLRSNLAAGDVELSAEVLEGIEKIHKRHPNPTP